MQELKDALRNSVYEAPEFFDTWLSYLPPDPTRMGRCRHQWTWNRYSNTWRWDMAATGEHPHQNILNILNSVLMVVKYSDEKLQGLDSHDRLADLIEHHDRPIQFDYEYRQGSGGPAIVQCFGWAEVYRLILDPDRPRPRPVFQNVARIRARNPAILNMSSPNDRDQARKPAHWQDVKLVVECKPEHSDFLDTLVRTVGFVRAQLIHQYWYTFAYAVFFIGTQATFLRVEPSGVIHSPTIDVLAEPERFVNAFAALLLLDYEQLGRGRAFRMPRSDTKPVSIVFGDPKPFYFLEDIVFQRHDVFGASTTALRVFHMYDNFVLKMSWKPRHYWREADILKELRGLFAIGRSRAYEEFLSTSDMSKFEYSLRARSLPGQEATRQASPSSEKQLHLNCLLMEAGKPLDSITEEAHYATAMIHIIFAIWALKNRGICHRDINPNNIIAISDDMRYPDDDSKCREEDFNYVYGEVQRMKKGTVSDFEYSEFRRLKRHSKRGVSSACVKLVGFGEAVDFTGGELYTRRVGDKAYMACTLLDPIDNARPLAQHFVHDLESLFWIAYLDLGLRRAPNEPTNPHIETLVNLKTKSYEEIRTIKRSLAASPEPDMAKAYGTAWASKTGGLVKMLCKFWLPYLQPGCTGNDAVAEGQDAFFDRLIGVYQEFIREVWEARKGQ